MDDAELLRSYARDGSESAFAEFVRRHLDLAYATALRVLGGDAHRAEDVAQRVFVQAARRAALLSERRVPSAWLYTVARNLAVDAVRQEQRRLRREQAFSTMNGLDRDKSEEADWARLRPVLDQALAGLKAAEREAVILRFFEKRLYPEIGARLAVSADAARLRVERALEKMGRVLAREGIPSTAAALASVLSAEAALAAPSGLAAVIAGGAGASGAMTGGGAIVHGAQILMATHKTAIALAAAAVIFGVTGALREQRTNARFAQEIARLASQSRDLASLQQNHLQLEKTLADRAALEAANRASARWLAESVPAPSDLEGLASKLAARKAKARRGNETASLTEPFVEGLKRLQPVVDAKNWDEAIRQLRDLESRAPSNSYDRFMVEDTLFKVEWQGKQAAGFSAALTAMDEIQSMLQQHPEYLSEPETVEHRQWQTDLNVQIAQSGSGAPDQWFPTNAR